MRSVIIALATVAATAAEAHIVCHDGYQVIHGQEISTPYCNDNYVGTIARRAGVKVSDAEIRNNPSKKAEVCRFVGSNIEVQEYCRGYNDTDRHGR